MSKKTFITAIITFSLLISFIATPVLGATEDSWTTKTPMQEARGYLQVAVTNGKIYAIGGSGPIGTNEEYDPATDNWTAKSPMPTP